MNKTYLRTLLTCAIGLFIMTPIHAKIPVWIFSAPSPLSTTVLFGETATIEYTVTNQSTHSKNLVLDPRPENTPPGLSASPCYLATKGSTCNLILTVNGSLVPTTGIHSGPVLCEQGSITQCYQPSAPNILNISVVEIPPNTTLSPLAQNLALSINSPGADPALVGNPRIIRIQNTGTALATNVQVSTSGLPNGTLITGNTCLGTLNAGATCDITITPGGNASLDDDIQACTTAPGTVPVPTTVTVSADNAPSANVNVLVLGYGCIYQGGFLFSVDDSTPNTGSIGGKVAAIGDQSSGTRWGPNVAVNGISETSMPGPNSCDGKNDGACNTGRIIAANLAPPVAAQLCEDLVIGGFSDWFMPAICELGRFSNPPGGSDAGCGTTNPNLYTTLHANNLGGFADENYRSSTEFSLDPVSTAWTQVFLNGFQDANGKTFNQRLRCVRAFIT